jgi:YggT family protein
MIGAVLFYILNLAIDIYRWILIGSVLASWVAPGSNHPVVLFLERVTEPVLAPIRKVLPAVGGMDLSPLAALVALHLIQRYVI